MENESCRDLASYIRKNFVYLSYGEFDGMNTEPTLTQLMLLKSFVENAIWEKMKERDDNN